jgi:HAD superfamily hydrolase (TIGR01549 family)
MSAPEALLFDFGGTLDADGLAWKDRFLRLFAEEAGGPPAGFDPAFYDADDALVGAVRPEMPFSETVRLLAQGVAERLGCPEAAPRVAERFLADASRSLASSRKVLERLSERYRLGIVSNFYGNLEAVCRETGLAPHLTAAVDSAVVGATKPDPRIFRAALSAVAALPAEAVFVGDSLPRDMAGARELGIQHVWVRSGEGSPCCPGDRVIGSVRELPEVLP